MASFNLGRIRGEKGDTGLSGEKGEQGERGAQGPQGVMGFTPVFSVKETNTIGESEGARVEMDSSNPQNPLLSFFIPKGADGKDALGDMISSIYDSQQKKSDVFEYADSLFEGSMKKERRRISWKSKSIFSRQQTAVCEKYCCCRHLSRRCPQRRYIYQDRN